MEKSFYPTIKSSIFLCLLLFALQVGFGIIIAIYQALSGDTDTSITMGVLNILMSVLIFRFVDHFLRYIYSDYIRRALLYEIHAVIAETAPHIEDGLVL